MGLTTKPFDTDLGLYNFGARWYDNQTGRWLSQEPLGFDGPNLYHFNWNNPTHYGDSDGLFAVLVAYPVGAGIGTATTYVATAAATAYMTVQCAWRATRTARCYSEKLARDSYCYRCSGYDRTVCLSQSRDIFLSCNSGPSPEGNKQKTITVNCP